MAAATESSQMTIRELADFITHLDEAIARQPEPDKFRTAVVEALSAECVQCSISVPGSDLQKLPRPEFSDPKLDRLRSGYCARNGCDSNFYRVIRAPHPQIDWPKLLNPARE